MGGRETSRDVARRRERRAEGGGGVGEEARDVARRRETTSREGGDDEMVTRWRRLLSPVSPMSAATTRRRIDASRTHRQAVARGRSVQRRRRRPPPSASSVVEFHRFVCSPSHHTGSVVRRLITSVGNAAAAAPPTPTDDRDASSFGLDMDMNHAEEGKTEVNKCQINQYSQS